MLRPLPDLSDEAYMLKLGKLSAIRSSRLDALHDMRDAVVRLQSNASISSVELSIIRECADRIEELDNASKSIGKTE